VHRGPGPVLPWTSVPVPNLKIEFWNIPEPVTIFRILKIVYGKITILNGRRSAGALLSFHSTMSRARRWCFTEYELAEGLCPEQKGEDGNEKEDGDVPRNSPAIDEAKCSLFERLGGDCRYVICQLEKCPRTGRPHWQGYANFTKAFGLSRLKTMLPTAHWEKSKGTEQDNIDYCTKDESRVAGPYSQGEPAKPGKRTDIEIVRSRINNGDSLVEIIQDENINSYQALRAAELLYKYRPIPKDFKHRDVYWFHGSTASGKTRAAHMMAEEAKQDLWVSGKDLMWFQRFHGQKWCLIDDFRSSHCSFSFLLRLLDGYAVSVPVKGTDEIWHPDVIIVTCPVHPKYTYTKKFAQDNGNLDQLLRRITEIRLYGEEIKPNEDWISPNYVNPPAM
jgi:hypothetical protein